MAVVLRGNQPGVDDTFVFDRAESTTGWTTVGSAAGLATGQSGGGFGNNAIPAKEGSGSVEFHLTAAGQTGGLQSPAIATGFAGTAREVGCWFLNPGEEAGGAKVLDDTDPNCLQLGIVHSGGTTYYSQNFIRAANNNVWPGGWVYLRASANLTNITRVVPRVNGCNAPNNEKQDLEYQIDYAKSYDVIQVSGTTETLDTIFEASLTNDWGLVERFGNFYIFNCGLEFLSGCTFTATNAVIFMNHYGNQFKQAFIVRSGANVTFGAKSTPSTVTYANSGCQLISPETALNGDTKPAPPFTVENGATFSAFDTLFQGWGTITFGEAGAGADPAVELNKCDFYDNDDVEFRSNALDLLNCRIHQDSADRGNLGTVFIAPNSLKQLQVFNSTNALEFEVDCTVEEYIASSNTTADLRIKEGATVKLRNSSYDDSKVVRYV